MFIYSKEISVTIIFSVMKGFLLKDCLILSVHWHCIAYNILTLFNFSLFVGLVAFGSGL